MVEILTQRQYLERIWTPTHRQPSPKAGEQSRSQETDHLSCLWLRWQLSGDVHIEVPFNDALQGLVLLHREYLRHNKCGKAGITGQNFQDDQS